MSDVIERIESGEIIIQAFGNEDGISKIVTDELLRLAKIGQQVSKGVTEILPHTTCKGDYKSNYCKDLNNNYIHGCVLKYYCKAKGVVSCERVLR